MGMDGSPINTQTSISKHAFFDLSHVSPLVFLYLLRSCYIHGTCKASAKFRALQHQVHLVLANNSQYGPATLIAHCLYILPIFGSYCEGISHLVLSSLRRFLKMGHNDEDLVEAKICAAKLFLGIVDGTLAYDEGVLIKILEVFDIDLMDIEKVMCGTRSTKADTAKEVVEKYVTKLIDLESYTIAVDVLINFSIRQFGESFLLKMMECRQFKAAEKWATHMGKSMLCLLVQEYVDQKLFKPAYDVIKKNNLRQEFPELYHQSKESSLKKLAEKGVWDVAETRAKGDRQLLEYLVYLAMEAGYFEKVEELCDHYSLKGFLNLKGWVELVVTTVPTKESYQGKAKVYTVEYFSIVKYSLPEPEENTLHNRYLHLDELFIEDVIWVDEVNILHDAICYFEECKVVGVDCEWKPNYEKGSRPNKVSIMQIASERKVFIFDLIKLYEDVPSVLDECLARILQSPSILKLGYNFQCDIKHLARSYGELNCFKHFEMLLDIQNVFKEPRGGLSGLAEKILGSGLNKTRRNSNWEQRPLSHYQQEYAALDAAVLLHIFRHVGSHSQPADGNSKIEWKSHIISHMDSTKNAQK